MKDLKEVIIGVKKICAEELLSVSPDMILDCSTRIFLRKPIINTSGNKTNPNVKIKDPESPATHFQKKKLVDMELEGLDQEKIDKLNKGEAHKLIAENINKPKDKPKDEPVEEPVVDY